MLLATAGMWPAGAHACAKGNDDSKREGPFTGACCQGHVRLNSGQLFLVCQVAEAQEEEFRRVLLFWTQWQAAPMETLSDLQQL